MLRCTWEYWCVLVKGHRGPCRHTRAAAETQETTS